MKNIFYLLICLILLMMISKAFSYSFPEIAQLKFEDHVFKMFQRVVDCEAIEKECYKWSEDYQDVVVHESLLKPSIERLQAEFELYKEELIQEETARLMEIARVDDINNRWKPLEQNIHLLMDRANLYQPNSALLLKDIIKNDRQADLAKLESEWVKLKVELDADKVKEEAKKKAKEDLKKLSDEDFDKMSLKDVIEVLKKVVL